MTARIEALATNQAFEAFLISSLPDPVIREAVVAGINQGLIFPYRAIMNDEAVGFFALTMAGDVGVIVAAQSIVGGDAHLIAHFFPLLMVEFADMGARTVRFQTPRAGLKKIMQDHGFVQVAEVYERAI